LDERSFNKHKTSLQIVNAETVLAAAAEKAAAATESEKNP
jgi:hypothetical protein